MSFSPETMDFQIVPFFKRFLADFWWIGAYKNWDLSDKLNELVYNDHLGVFTPCSETPTAELGHRLSVWCHQLGCILSIYVP